MSDLVFDLSTITDNDTPSMTEGRYDVVVDTAEMKVYGTGTKGVVVNYKVLNTNQKINFDSFALIRQDGSRIDFGLRKLKKLAEVTKTISGNDLNVPELIKALPGKTLQVDVEINENGYPEVQTMCYYELDLPQTEGPAEEVNVDFDFDAL